MRSVRTSGKTEHGQTICRNAKNSQFEKVGFVSKYILSSELYWGGEGECHCNTVKVYVSLNQQLRVAYIESGLVPMTVRPGVSFYVCVAGGGDSSYVT